VWALLALALLGCVKKPYQSEVCERPDASGCVIEEVEIQGTTVAPDKVKEKIATTETSRPLGGALANVPVLSIIDRVQVDYGRVDPFVLERDLARVERFYRAQGYYEAHARAGRVVKLPDGKIKVEIAVDQGRVIKIAKIAYAWQEQPSAADKARVADAIQRALTDQIKVGKPFEEDPYEATKKLVVRAMTDEGYAYAAVSGDANVDLVKHEANVVYTLSLGPRCKFGAVKFANLGDLPEPLFRDAADINEGDDYSTSKLESAQVALANFGVLGAIDVKSETSPPGTPQNPIVPITFKAQKTQLRTLRFGMGGLIGDRLEAHGIAGWEHKNFLGGLRHFTIDGQPGFIFYPVNISNIFTQAPTQVLPEVLVRTELKQPLWFSPRTNFVIGGSFNFYRLQTSDTLQTTDLGYIFTDRTIQRVEENVVGYREVAGRVGFERSFFENKLYAGTFYNLQFDNPFSYNQDAPPPGFLDLVIGYIDVVGSLDYRRDADGKPDKLHPNRGFYFTNDFQVAGHIFGGDASDVRIRPEVRAYLPLSRKVTVAYRGTLGMLFPTNYARSLTEPPACTTDVDPARARDLQILQFRAFFSGGPNSNRGYPQNGVGPQEDAHFLEQNAPCGELVVATGGLSLWEQSLELRVPIIGKLGGVVFVDASDVTRKIASFRLTVPHMSTGVGLRYDTPVGPLRADFGYRIPCMQVVGQCKDDVPLNEGQGSIISLSTRPNGDTFGFPFALSIAIGEAF
jgi:outer membrane protein insertion porin family/translocation and assembly module TamA